MTTGCVIFAYNGDIDYGSQAVLAARLVIKHLKIPVTLITDIETFDKVGTSVFEKVIVYSENSENTRVLDGKVIAFKNSTRSSAFELSPYDRTLVIDSDFLVFSNRLLAYLESNNDFMICPGMNDLHPNRTGHHVLLHPASIPMVWATNIIFNKTPEVKTLFNLVDHIRENWEYYGALYKFDTRRFRNDYAFSIACHTLGGYGVDKFYTNLPEPILITDKDQILKISKEGSITAILGEQDSVVIKTQGQDIHMINKTDLLNHLSQLEELAND